MSTAVKLIDVRTVPPAQRHPLIFGIFDALETGQTLEIVNDHDPVPLNHQFQQTRDGQFDWQYLKAGPDLWHCILPGRHGPGRHLAGVFRLGQRKGG